MHPSLSPEKSTKTKTLENQLKDYHFAEWNWKLEMWSGKISTIDTPQKSTFTGGFMILMCDRGFFFGTVGDSYKEPNSTISPLSNRIRRGGLMLKVRLVNHCKFIQRYPSKEAGFWWFLESWDSVSGIWWDDLLVMFVTVFHNFSLIIW